MRSWALAAAALVAMLGVARADGLPSPAYGCCGSPTWSGVYAGFQAGGAWGDTGWSFPLVESFNTAPGQHFSTNPGGAVFGGQVGLNQQFGGILLGAEVSFVGTEIRETLRPAALAPDRFKTAISNVLTVTGRAGLPLGNQLLYGKAGYANANVELGALSPVSGITADAGRREDGWVAGAGWEYRMGRSFVFGVEYTYMDLSGSRFATTTGGAVPGLPFHVALDDVHTQMVVARLSILLDRGPTASK